MDLLKSFKKLFTSNQYFDNPLKVLQSVNKSNSYFDIELKKGKKYPFLQKFTFDNYEAFNEEIYQVNMIANDVFSSADSLVDIDELKEWIKASPNSWLIYKESLVEGFIHVEVIKKSRAELIRKGISHEGEIESKDILDPLDATEDDYIHIGSLVNRNYNGHDKKKQYYIALYLLLGLVEYIWKIIHIKESSPYKIIAVDYPDKSGNHNANALLRKYGFTNENGEKTSEGDNIYLLDLKQIDNNQPLRYLLENIFIRRNLFKDKIYNKEMSEEKSKNSTLSFNRLDKIKVLYLASNPTESEYMNLHEEYVKINQVLSSYGREKILLEDIWDVTAIKFQKSILKYKPHIIHFTGHGEEKNIKLQELSHKLGINMNDGSGIVVDNGLSKKHVISSEALINTFKIISTIVDIKLVMLSACHSENQAKGISLYIPYVIGMSKQIGFNSAILFSTTFYSSLLNNFTPEISFELAKNLLELYNLKDSNIPILYVNGKKYQSGVCKNG